MNSNFWGIVGCVSLIVAGIGVTIIVFDDYSYGLLELSMVIFGFILAFISRNKFMFKMKEEGV